MSLWEFLACTEGYREAHGQKKERGTAEVDDHRLRSMGIKGF